MWQYIVYGRQSLNYLASAKVLYYDMRRAELFRVQTNLIFAIFYVFDDRHQHYAYMTSNFFNIKPTLMVNQGREIYWWHRFRSVTSFKAGDTPGCKEGC
jgi:hypothetical protein